MRSFRTTFFIVAYCAHSYIALLNAENSIRMLFDDLGILPQVHTMSSSNPAIDTRDDRAAQWINPGSQEQTVGHEDELPESLSLSIASQCRQVLAFQDRLEQANRRLQSLKPSDCPTCFLSQHNLDPYAGFCTIPCIGQPIDPLIAPSIRQALRDVDVGINAVGAWLRNTIEPDIVRQAFPTDLGLPPGLVSSRALEIPELLENILCRLPVSDLLQAEQVNKRFKDVIASSSQLQSELYRRPDQDSKFRSFLQGPDTIRAVNLVHLGISADIRCEHYVDPLDPTATLSPYAAVNFKFMLPRGLPLRIGSNIRSMSACQPPMKNLIVSTDCCTSMAPDFKARLFELYPQRLPANKRAVAITSARGFTIGDLVDISTRLSSAHRLCPYAPVRMLRDDGYVYCNVMFAGRVQLQLTDPFQYVDSIPPPMLLPDESHELGRTSLLRRYRRAKIAGERGPRRPVTQALTSFSTRERWRDTHAHRVPTES